MQKVLATISLAFRPALFLGLLAACLGVPVPGLAQGLPPGISSQATEKIADGLYLFRYGPYRSLFMVTSAGVIATDPQSPEAAVAYRAAIAELTDLPVRYVVYSHAHWDHARGGQVFKDEGAQFVAQARCVDNLREAPNADIVPPDITFESTYSVSLGGQSWISSTTDRATAPAW